jgi:predicted phosphodiesterase
MRIAVISDIHGNLDALEAVAADMVEVGVDGVVCLGDCIGYGAQPQAVLQWMAATKCLAVAGNHELAAVDRNLLNWLTPAARRSLEITFGLIGTRELRFISSLPLTIQKWGARFVHGIPPDSAWRYLSEVSAEELRLRLAQLPERICFVGHTHFPELVNSDGRCVVHAPLDRTPVHLDARRRYIVNAGSVGQPRDGDPAAKYVIWEPELDRIFLRRVPYPYRIAAARIIQAGLPEIHALMLMPAPLNQQVSAGHPEPHGV